MRVSQKALVRIDQLGADIAEAVLAVPPQVDQWREAVVPIESIDHAARLLIAFAADIEVLAPLELREQIAARARRVLALYDGEFRNLNSRLTDALPDLYIDVQNAASMLFRLQRHGVDVGNRWEELADRAEARIGDCLSAFTLPHWMMALTATGRHEAAHRMLEAMHAFARNPGITASLVARYALPICEAVLAHGRGEFAEAVEAMRPVLGGMYRLGGSHAQQDVLEQLYLDSAMQAGSHDDARLLLERIAGRHPLPPQRRIGYAAAARAVGL